MASKENFLKAHWEWLVMGAGILALAASTVVLMGRLGESPEDAAMQCEARLRADRKSVV